MSGINIVSVHYTDIEALMHIAFKDDPDLLSLYTPAPETLEQCVARSYANVVEMFTGEVYKDSEKNAYAIELRHDDVVRRIGFMVTAKTDDLPNELYSFGINIHYRSRTIVLKWLGIVHRMLGKTFWTSLYGRNSRAINFFERNGFKKIESESRQFVSLWSNFD